MERGDEIIRKLENNEEKKYIVEEKIGSGGSGNVYKVYDNEGKKYAVKIVNPNVVAGGERLEREYNATQELNHPHIVVPEAMFDFMGYKHLLMQYIEGKTLKKDIQERKYTLEDIFKFGVNFFNILSYMESKKVWHRDIKPSNIIITQDGTPTLIDFGLVRRENEEDTITVTEDRIGTLEYMAPELFEGKHRKDINYHKSDIYSTGIIFYELFSGERLQINTGIKRLKGRITPLEKYLKKRNFSYTRKISDVIMKALHTNPSKRFVSYKEFSDVFVQACTVTEDELTSKDIRELVKARFCKQYARFGQAVSFYSSLVEKGCVEAMEELGRLYSVRSKYTCKEDMQKARDLYEQASLRNSRRGLNNLAYYYQYGYGGEKNKEKAKELYLKACSIIPTDPEHLIPFGGLINLLHNNYTITDQEYEASYMGSVMKKNIDIMNVSNIGHVYYKRTNSGDDSYECDNTKEIVRLYATAFGSKNRTQQCDAMIKIASSYPLGGIQNHTKAVGWYTRAIELGSIKARRERGKLILMLGDRYCNGEEGEKNYNLADYCYKQILEDEYEYELKIEAVKKIVNVINEEIKARPGDQALINYYTNMIEKNFLSNNNSKAIQKLLECYKKKSYFDIRRFEEIFWNLHETTNRCYTEERNLQDIQNYYMNVRNENEKKAIYSTENKEQIFDIMYDKFIFDHLDGAQMKKLNSLFILGESIQVMSLRNIIKERMPDDKDNNTTKVLTLHGMVFGTSSNVKKANIMSDIAHEYLKLNEPDYLKAKQWYRRAIKLGHPRSKREIGKVLYELGSQYHGIGATEKKNYSVAEYYYRRIIENKESTSYHAAALEKLIHIACINVENSYKGYDLCFGKQKDGYLFYNVAKVRAKILGFYKDNISLNSINAMFLFKDLISIHSFYCEEKSKINNAKNYQEIAKEKIKDEIKLKINEISRSEITFITSGEEEFDKSKEILKSCENNIDAVYRLGYMSYFGIGERADLFVAKAYFDLVLEHKEPKFKSYNNKMYSSKVIALEKGLAKELKTLEEALKLENLPERTLKQIDIVEDLLGISMRRNRPPIPIKYNIGKMTKIIDGVFEKVLQKNYGYAILEGLKDVYDLDVLNHERTKRGYDEAIKYGNTYAMYEMGMTYMLRGNFIHGIELLSQAADYGDADAMEYMGYIYRAAHKDKYHSSMTESVYKRGIKRGTLTVLKSLADTYSRDSSMPWYNLKRSIEIYEQLAKISPGWIASDLAYLYTKQDRNYKKAFEVLQRGAQLGNKNAIYDLGCFYYKGYGTRPNYEKAKDYFLLFFKKLYIDSGNYVLESEQHFKKLIDETAGTKYMSFPWEAAYRWYEEDYRYKPISTLKLLQPYFESFIEQYIKRQRMVTQRIKKENNED